jgi:CRP-like cAMP-binding protein
LDRFGGRGLVSLRPGLVYAARVLAGNTETVALRYIGLREYNHLIFREEPAIAREDYDHRRKRQSQSIAVTKADGSYKGRHDALAVTTFLSAKGRLARALIDLAEYVGEDNGGGRIQLRLKISQGDLAAMAGVARENVSRTISEWRKRDIVTTSSNYYRINNPRALAQDMELDS